MPFSVLRCNGGDSGSSSEQQSPAHDRLWNRSRLLANCVVFLFFPAGTASYCFGAVSQSSTTVLRLKRGTWRHQHTSKQTLSSFSRSHRKTLEKAKDGKLANKNTGAHLRSKNKLSKSCSTRPKPFGHVASSSSHTLLAVLNSFTSLQMQSLFLFFRLTCNDSRYRLHLQFIAKHLAARRCLDQD